MEVYLIRHTAVDVPSGICYGQSDVPLKETFETEAATVKNQISHLKFDAVYCSPLSRCVKLATYCNHGNAIREDRLKEINFGEWELMPWSNINDPQKALWFENWETEAPTGGESFEQMYNRISGFLEELKTQNYNKVILFVHGGVIACARIFVKELTSNQAFEKLTPYGGIVKINI